MIYPIILLAALVRLWSLDFGLPYFFHFDESAVIYTSFYAGNSLLRPDSFIQPMLLRYVLILIYGIYFLLGKVVGFWTTPEQFYTSYLQDPTAFLLLGRLFTVLMGVCTVWLVYWVGKKVYSKAVGLMAAFFLSLAFLHVQESHYIKEDVFLGFLGLIIYYFVFLTFKNNRFKDYLLVGLFLGLAASVKYNFFILLGTFMTVQFIKAYQNRSAQILFEKKFYLSLFVVVITFLLLNPYILIDHQRAFPEIGYQAKLVSGQWVSSEGLPVWLYYLTYHLRFGLGLPLFLLVIAGMSYLLFKMHRLQELLLVVMPVTFFVTILIFGSTNAARYAVMILPQMVLVAAIFCQELVNYLKSKYLKSGYLLIIISFLVITPSFLRVIKFDYYISSPDTRILVKDWIEKNIPNGTKIVNEGAIRSELLAVYGPPLAMEINSLQGRLKRTQELGLPGTTLKALIEANRHKIGYDLIGTVGLDYFLDPISGSYQRISGVEEYIKGGYCYLVTSSWARQDRGSYSGEFTQSLETNYQAVKEFVPNPILLDDPIWKVDFSKLDQVDIGKGNTIAGPVIRIYKIKYLKNC